MPRLSSGKRMSLVTRFAPSPTGRLHLGHAYSALFAWRSAEAGNGRFLLRIEDIDPGRCRPEFTTAIEEDLAWLGLDWPRPVRRQSQHMAEYRTAVDRLTAEKLLYPCFCTRAEIRAEIARAVAAPHGPDGPIYPGTCRHLSLEDRTRRIAGGAPYALRLDTAVAMARTGRLAWHDLARGEIEARPDVFGDVVLARKDTPASYHLAVTLDDAAQGVSLVTRGEDLFASTHVHRLLQALLGLPTPEYHHHRLVADQAGRRLAKRHEAPTLADLRAAGHTPCDIKAMIAD